MKKIKNFTDIEQVFGKEKRQPKEISLDNIRNYLLFDNNPQKKLKAIQIAGTNGKGSTAAILESILTSHNIKTGLFTSPHLINYNERFRIDGQEINNQELFFIFNGILQKLRERSLSLTLFEALTIAAIDYFLEKEVELAIFETGLGGRLDATNILDSKIQIITDISKDHTEFLGDSLKKIAQEKAGIIKNNSIVITSNDNQEILHEIMKKSKEKNSKIEILEKNEITDLSFTRKNTNFTLKRKETQFKNLKLSLIGRHQATNASLAIIALKKILKTYYPNQKISQRKLRKGLKETRWPGRFEVIRLDPCIILDGAHNPAGMSTLIKTLKDLNIKNPVFYFASKKDKDVFEELTSILNLSSEVFYVMTGIENMFDPKDLPEDLKSKIKIIKLEDLEKRILKNKKSFSVICGSLYFVGLFKKILRTQNAN